MLVVNNNCTLNYIPNPVNVFFRVLSDNMNINEGKIVFNYLKEKHGNEREAYIMYDKIDMSNKKIILKNIIISYLVDHYWNSLLFNHPTWSPEKRRYRIMEYAMHKYDKMDEEESEIIIEKILDN